MEYNRGTASRWEAKGFRRDGEPCQMSLFECVRPAMNVFHIHAHRCMYVFVLELTNYNYIQFIHQHTCIQVDYTRVSVCRLTGCFTDYAWLDGDCVSLCEKFYFQVSNNYYSQRI